MEVYTVDEAATILGVGPATIRLWLRDGLLEGYKLRSDKSGSPWRIYGWSIRQELAKRHREPPDNEIA